MRTYGVVILVCGLLLAGCGEKETVTSTESAPAKVKKTTVVEQVKQSADDVAKQAATMVETGTQLVKDTAVDAKQAVEEVVATATENVTAAAVVTKEKTAEFVDSSKQKAAEVKEQLMQEGTQLLNDLQKSPAASETQSNSLSSSVTNMVNTTTVASSVTTPSEITTEIQASETLVSRAVSSLC